MRSPKRGGLGGWPQGRVRITDATESHAVGIAFGHAAGPVAELGAVPFELVVRVAELARRQVEQRIVFAIRRGHEEQPRPELAEHGTLHHRQ